MASLPNYPAPGCIVEFLEGNAVNIAYVLEESSGKLRLLLPGRRESKLSASRILPWVGPMLAPGLGREDALRSLEEHRQKREEKTAAIQVAELWELTQGEIAHAPVRWFAELMEADIDADILAAYGRALLDCKTHFRFQPPEFEVFNADTVQKRLAERAAKAAREALIAGGAAFLRLLWDVACKKRQMPADPEALPDADVAARLQNILSARVANPDCQDDEALWQLLRKGLPDAPHLPLQLLTAWGKLPKHYNFWLDRADYLPGDDWWQGAAAEVETLKSAAAAEEAEFCDLPFISIDSVSTRDIDDAFYIESGAAGGWRLVIALAAPALAWPFGSPLDKMVARRATSVYLPEGDMHMLPECVGTDACSLLAGRTRGALLLRMDIDAAGNITACEPGKARISLAANLNYDDCQAVLDAIGSGAPLPANPASAYASQLGLAHKMALTRQKFRIDAGAVIMERPEPEVILDMAGGDVRVDLRQAAPAADAQRLVAEMMIVASSAMADWARERKLPLLHRSQAVAIPREYAGIWTKPEDLTRIMRALAPSTLDVAAKPHAALAVPRYAPLTSPLRRYTDLINEAQILHYLDYGKPRWSEAALGEMLDSLSPVLEGASHIQKYRPRYWKLLYFRQMGDKIWWDGVITEENDMFANVSLPEQGIFVRGKRNMFDERACPGQHVRLRLGKVNPLYNEIQILEVLPAE